jgi:diacylglycerol kinase (ATP)
MAENRVFFIINRFAGTGFQPAVEGRIIDACARLNLECIIEYTMRKGHATDLAWRAVEEGFTRVFAMGGDGTVNEVAKGLVHTPVALGILPKGSGNGLARHLGIPLGFAEALTLLDRHQVINMDTLLVNKLLSVNVSGLGFDAHVAAQFGQDGKRGLIGYARLVMREFKSFQEFEVQATLGESSFKKKSFIIALANSSQFGNNVRVAPFASVCDGVMDICFIRKAPLSNALKVALQMFLGNINQSEWVEILKARRFNATCAIPLPFHIDGEPQPPAKEFEVEMQPGSLKMIVPASGLRF